ncbi:MAG: 4-hydroxyphenylpyruvate dioxygenase, partial [Myxococcales bacterium]|nr:4-hydroxyphenylpyruvate dioxygenase [Myxococcales bacterium]
MARSTQNPLGLCGIAFVEFAGPDPAMMDKIFKAFGFSRRLRVADADVAVYDQGAIRFLVNQDSVSFAHRFGQLHGPSICSMGWCFDDP